MSCFENLFTLKKGELNKIIKNFDKSIPVRRM